MFLQRMKVWQRLATLAGGGMKNTSENAQNTEKLASQLRQMVEHFKV